MVLKLDLDMVVTSRMLKIRSIGQAVQKLSFRYTDGQTDRGKIFTYPHTRAVIKTRVCWVSWKLLFVVRSILLITVGTYSSRQSSTETGVPSGVRVKFNISQWFLLWCNSSFSCYELPNELHHPEWSKSVSTKNFLPCRTSFFVW